MADSKPNRPTRTLSDIRPPSQTKSAPAPATKKTAKKSAPEKAPAASTPAVTSHTPSASKKGRPIWKGVVTTLIIVALIATVAAVYYYIFSS